MPLTNCTSTFVSKKIYSQNPACLAASMLEQSYYERAESDKPAVMKRVAGFRCVLADQTSTMPELINMGLAVTYIKEQSTGQAKNTQSVEVEGKFVHQNDRNNVVTVSKTGEIIQALFLCALFLSKMENVHLFLKLTPTLRQMPRDVTNISAD